jgi:protein TonB
MESANHTIFFLFTLLVHVTGILLISNQMQQPLDVTLAELEISSVELNLADAAQDSLPSPPPEPEQMKPMPAPEPEPEPEPTPEPLPDPVAAMEADPVILPEKKPEPPPVPEQIMPEPRPEPPPKKIEKKTDPPPVKKVEKPLNPEPQPPRSPQPPPEMAASTTPESGAATGQIDVPPRPRRTIKPKYPTGARRRGESGAVTLAVQINAAGKANEVTVKISSGFPELDQAARQAVQSARFNPGTVDGQPVASEAGLTIIFKLH